MKPGRVVSIRLNPRDCLAVIDVVEKLSLNIRGMSFSQAVSIALASAMESLRQAGAIPERDGFEFTEMMQRYPAVTKGARGQALRITNAMRLAGPDVQVPAAAPSREVTQARIRLDELLLRCEADPLNASAEDKAELERLASFLANCEKAAVEFKTQG